jgi:hypothetical protein
MPDSISPSPVRRLPVTSPVGSAPIHVIRADLRCLLCTLALGVLEAQRWPAADPVLFRPRSGASAVQVAKWWNLRCPTCGGNSYADEVAEVRVHPTFSCEDGQARRGRPPRWLVEERQAAHGASAF